MTTNTVKKIESDAPAAQSCHKSVLLNEVINGLSVKKGDNILDATVNGGGHSATLARRFGNSISLIGLDADAEALLRAKENIPGKKILLNYNFRRLDEALKEAKIAKVSKMIFDLGLSSDQLERSGRGFSFQREEPLLMTFDKEGKGNGFTAGDIVNSWQKENIETVIRSYGEEKFASRIAKAIVEAREKSPIKTSKALAEIIKASYPIKFRYGKIHPATKTFQALRMTVNDEIGALKEALEKSVEYLESGGRVAIISFHSLEDRIVKNFIKDQKDNGVVLPITKKPIVPTKEEITENPRSRSAKLRIFEKL